jgi:hypothetical protein
VKDLNGDGFPDAVAAGSDSIHLTVLINAQ